MSTVSVTNVVSTMVQATEIRSNSPTLPVMIENNAGVEVGWFARAWVNFDGTSGTIRAAGNVSSVVRNALGIYTLNFATAMPDINYTVSGGGRCVLTTDRGYIFSGLNGSANTPSTLTTSAVTVSFVGTNGSSVGANDGIIATVVVHR